jgi:2-phospho-L-lactate transferase/gluconeogenesis factor (CofD/UPF0052 family)/hydroxymethylpyrimidine pyrophosphatase-like HAD family hydrolase|tara:strand:+ start:2285 stop:4666 length:2382 start_codon:yes stop_codon:yes gene_type:complete
MKSDIRIVIFSGGRGATNIHKGLRHHFKDKGIRASIVHLINAYDDGLSTGAVRQLIPGGMLGPSDVRKLQFMQYEVEGGEKAVIDFFNFRFKNHQNEFFNQIKDISKGQYPKCALGRLTANLPNEVRDLTKMALSFIVSLPEFRSLRFDDFSLANLVYAGLAGTQNNSIQSAELIMREVLNLRDPVVVNSLTNAFLFALTEDGKLLRDEGSIVSYKQRSPIYSLFMGEQLLTQADIDKFERLADFEDKKHFLFNLSSALPTLSMMASKLIDKANLIIYAPGTQYTSLYPTYWTVGLPEVLCKARALKIMVTNIVKDNEIPEFRVVDIIRQAVYYFNEKGKLDYSASDLIDAVLSNDPLDDSSSYVRPNRTELEQMGLNSVIIEQGIELKQKGLGTGKHDPNVIAKLIDKTFNDKLSRLDIGIRQLTGGVIAFDMDDTLFADRRKLLVWGASGSQLNVDRSNLNLLLELMEKGFTLLLLTGNDFSAVENNFLKVLFSLASSGLHIFSNLTIYANGCTTKYQFSLKSSGYEVDEKFSKKYRIGSRDRQLIANILQEGLKKLNEKYQTIEEVFKIYDSDIWKYNSLPNDHSVRDDYAQMIIKPIPSSFHCRVESEGVDDRLELYNFIIDRMDQEGLSNKYVTLMRGWGTIEIQDKRVDKYTALKDFLDCSAVASSDVLFFGNELSPSEGNDFSIAREGIFVIAVSQDEATLPRLPNVVYGGHRGVATTGFHLEYLLETFEKNLHALRTGETSTELPVTRIYANKLLLDKAMEQLNLLSDKGDLDQDKLKEIFHDKS